MALWKPFRGNRADLDAIEKHDGYVYFCTDDGALFFDYADADGNLQRKQISAKDAETLTGYTFDQIIEAAKATASAQDVVVLAEAQAYTDEKTKTLTDDEFIAWLNEENIVTPTASASGEIYTSNNNEIYIL